MIYNAGNAPRHYQLNVVKIKVAVSQKLSENEQVLLLDNAVSEAVAFKKVSQMDVLLLV